MSTSKPKRKKAPQEASKAISIFISYASEDRELASCFEAELLQLFSFSTAVNVFRDVNMERGKNYRNVIAAALNSADILLVILTDRMKPSYAYPGFEIGFFSKSLEERRYIFGNVERVIIPVCIGAENPATLDYLQAIQIDKNQVFKISDINVPKEGAIEPITDIQNPAYSLLSSISHTIMNFLSRGVEEQNNVESDKKRKVMQDRLAVSAGKLYSVIGAYLQGRVFSETYPERKIVIRADAPIAILPDGADLSGATVELIGNSFQVFGFPEEKERQFTWAQFRANIVGDFGGTWTAGIRALVTDALQARGENYHVVATTRGDKAFRLFVSRIVTYVSKKTEIHIYIVEMVVRHYGDPLTSRLLSGISVGLQFRFLFLEPRSKFRPEIFDYPMSVDEKKEMDVWKAAVTEMLSQLDLLLRDAQDEHLMDADLLGKIWGCWRRPPLDGNDGGMGICP